MVEGGNDNVNRGDEHTMNRHRRGKRKFDGGHQNQGETKRRYQSSWGSQPLAQQPLSNAYGMNGGGYSSGSDAQWYQDSYQWS